MPLGTAEPPTIEVERTPLAPPVSPEDGAETATGGPIDSATGETGPDGERIIEDPAEAAIAAAEGETTDSGRFKRAPFKTPEFPEFDRSITLGVTDEADSARVAILDMVSATTETVELQAGRPAAFQRLTLTLVACAKPEQRGGIGDVGLLEVADARQGDDPVFTGWMFAESPALSALDHPRYDVWLISCIARSPETSGGSASNDASRASASDSSAR
ncbi:MAG: DUF2155 domain-containing protein [Pseudomonadota bacterium]